MKSCTMITKIMICTTNPESYLRLKLRGPVHKQRCLKGSRDKLNLRSKNEYGFWIFFVKKIKIGTLTCQKIVQQILLSFLGKTTYTTLLGSKSLLISDIFASNPDFHLHKWEKNPSYTALLGPTRLLISEKSATYTIKWSYTINWQVRVGKY